MHPSRQLAAILRDTLHRVELSTDIDPHNRSLFELKLLLLFKIDALEAEAKREEGGPQHP
jgi:hypothetical protein